MNDDERFAALRQSFFSTDSFVSHWGAAHSEWLVEPPAPWTRPVQYSYYGIIPMRIQDQIAREIYPVVDVPYLDLLRPGTLHFTIASVAHVWEVSDEKLSRLESTLDDIDPAGVPTEIVLGGLNATDEGVFLEARPSHAITSIRRALVDEAQHILDGRPHLLPSKTQRYFAHTSTAYANQTHPTTDMQKVINEFKDVEFGPFSLNIALVRLSIGDHGYEFDIVRNRNFGT